MDTSAIFLHQYQERYLHTQEYNIISSTEAIQPGSIIDRILTFLSTCITYIRKFIISVGQVIIKRFRNDFHINKQIKAYTEKVQSLYKTIDKKNRKGNNINIDEIIGSLELGTFVEYDVLSSTINNFKDACKTVHTDIIKTIDSNIDNIFSNTTVLDPNNVLGRAGIKVGKDGTVFSDLHLEQISHSTLAELGYTKDTVVEIGDLAVKMYDEYEKTQYLTNSIQDLEKKLSQQMKYAKYDMVIASSIQDKINDIGAIIKNDIAIVNKLITFLMSMYMSISRRVRVLLSNVVQTLRTRV